MINMPIADIMTLITSEVEKPAAPDADGDMGDASFLSFITGDDPELGQPVDVPDKDVGRNDNSVDTPETRAMFLSDMTDQKLAFLPAAGLLKLDDALSVQNRSSEKTTNIILPELLAGPTDDAPDIVLAKVPVEPPALQDTDAAVDVLRLMSETASIPQQVVVLDKRANAAISNDAPKQVPLPATPVMPQIGSSSFLHNVLPPIVAMTRPHVPVLSALDLVPSPSATTALPMAPGLAPNNILDAPLADKNTSDKQSRQAPAEVTEIKQNGRGQSMLLPQTPKGAENLNVIIPPKSRTISMPPNQQPAAAYAGVAPDAPQAAPALLQTSQVPPLPVADLPVITSRPTPNMLAPHPVKAPKVLTPDDAQMTKAQSPLPQHMPNPPAGDMSDRVDPLQTQATTSAPLQVIKSAHLFAPLQPTVLVPQSPKRQMSEGQLPEPDAQPVKLIAIDAPAQSTVPAVQPPITPVPEAPALEGSLSDLNPELIPLEARATDSTSIARHDAITNRPEVGRHIAQQLAEVARQMPDRPVELTLNPDELGRVRLMFTMSDGGIHVAVIAERGETMDLLRRHIETLAQEFRDMGYKDVNFEFGRNGQGGSGNADSNPDDPDTLTQTPIEMQTLAPVQLSLEPSTGLDLRL